MLEITDDQRKQLLEYLARRPYLEAAPLIAMLASLKKKENKKSDGVTPKKQ